MKIDLLAAKQYEPTAIYYEDSDSLEYVREAVPSIYRRIDGLLTLVLRLEDRALIGFKLKGFKNFYLRKLKPTWGDHCPEFIELVDVVSNALELVGEQVLREEVRRQAYDSALKIAAQDNIHVRDFPKIAV
jgi:hypothetical protein